MSKVFISHAEEDADVALTVALELESAGFTTWSYEVDCVPGPSYLIQTGESVERADVVVLIISATSLGSHQVTREVVRGLETGKPFVPLLRNVTHVEFQNRQPEWRSAVGAATSIQIPREGVLAILPRIVAGLEALGVERSSPRDAARLSTITEVLGTYTGTPKLEANKVESALSGQSEPSPVATGPRRRRNAMVLAVSLIGILIVGLLLWTWQGTVPTEVAHSRETLVEPTTPEDVLDVAKQRENLVVLSDRDGHYVAVVPYWEKGDAEYFLYYGSARVLHAQRVRGGGAEGRVSFSYSFWEPRFDSASITFRDNLYTIHCGSTKIALAPVQTSESEVVLTAGEFLRPMWKHYAYALARDDVARYFYVDRSWLDERQFRLFIGTGKALDAVAIMDATTDSAGSVITTDNGVLSVMLSNGEVDAAKWIVDGEPAPLVPMAVWPNRSFIYGPELGVYPDGLGTPCDILTGADSRSG